MKKLSFILFLLVGSAYANNLDKAKSDCENATDPEQKAMFCSVYQQMLDAQKVFDAYGS